MTDVSLVYKALSGVAGAASAFTTYAAAEDLIPSLSGSLGILGSALVIGVGVYRLVLRGMMQSRDALSLTIVQLQTERTLQADRASMAEARVEAERELRLRVEEENRRLRREIAEFRLKYDRERDLRVALERSGLTDRREHDGD